MAKARKFGKAEVEVSVRDNVGKGLDAIKRRMHAFGAGLQSVGRNVSAIGAGAAASLGGLKAAMALATREFVNFGDQIHKTSLRLGIGARELTGLKFAAEQSGTSIESVGAAMFRANRRIANATKGTGPAVRALTELGLSAKVLNAQDTDTRFLTIAEALSKMQDETLAAQYGFEIFGDNFRDIKPLIDEGASGILKLRKEAEDLGITLTDADANGAAALGDSLNRMRQTIRGTVIQIGAALAPAVKQAVDVFVEVSKSIVKFVRDNRQMVVAIAGGVTAGLALATAVGGIGAGIALAGVAVSGFVALFGALGTVLGIVLSPLGLIVAAVAGLVGFALHASNSLGTLSQMFGELGKTAVDSWGGIVGAIQSGELELAGQVAMAALDVGWQTLTTNMRQVWAKVTDYFGNVWLDAVKWIIDAGAGMYFSLAKTFDKLGVALANGFDIGFTYIVGAIDSIQTSIAKAIISAQEFFGLFNEEQATQIRKSLDNDLERRGAARQRGLNSRGAERLNDLQARDGARRQAQQGFARAIAQEINARRSSTTVDRSGLTSAQKRLAELNAKSAESVAKSASGNAATSQTKKALEGVVGLARGLGGQTNNIKAIGSSSAAAIAAGALGIGQKPETETAKNTRLMARQMKKMLRRKTGFQ